MSAVGMPSIVQWLVYAILSFLTASAMIALGEHLAAKRATTNPGTIPSVPAPASDPDDAQSAAASTQRNDAAAHLPHRRGFKVSTVDDDVLELMTEVRQLVNAVRDVVGFVDRDDDLGGRRDPDVQTRSVVAAGVELRRGARTEVGKPADQVARFGVGELDVQSPDMQLRHESAPLCSGPEAGTSVVPARIVEDVPDRNSSVGGIDLAGRVEPAGQALNPRDAGDQP